MRNYKMITQLARKMRLSITKFSQLILYGNVEISLENLQ